MQGRLTPYSYLFKSIFWVMGSGMIMLTAFSLVPSLWMIVVSLLLALLCLWALVSKARKTITTVLKRHPEAHPFSPNLGRIIKTLASAAGLHEGVTLVDYNVSDEIVKKMNAEKKSYKPQYVLNAGAAFGSGNFVMISEPMLKILDDEEEKGILGHEVAHLALRHVNYSLSQYTMTLATVYAFWFVLLDELWKFGWLPIAASALAFCIPPAVLRAFHDDADVLVGKNLSAMSAYDLITRDRLRRIERICSYIFLVGAAAIFDRYFPILFVKVYALLYAAGICEAAGKRNREYEADEASAALTANPLGLATGLRKMKLLEQRSLQKEMKDWVPRAGFLMRTFRRAFATHPETPDRVDRLCKLAAKGGADIASIRAIREGPLALPEGEEIRYDVIKHYLRQL